MKSFLDQNEVDQIMNRLARLSPDSQRQWGKMTSHQMICHLSDAYQVAMGEREEKWAGNFFTQTLVKKIALSGPMKWPQGVKTRPASDQEIGGTKPVDFEQDRKKLQELIGRFCAGKRDFEFALHPVFGKLSIEEWMRWGYLHADHHFRQFGI